METTEKKILQHRLSVNLDFPNPRSAEKFFNSMESLSLMRQHIEGKKTTQNLAKMSKKEDDKASEKETERKEEEYVDDADSTIDHSDDELFFPMDDVNDYKEESCGKKI